MSVVEKPLLIIFLLKRKYLFMKTLCYMCFFKRNDLMIKTFQVKRLTVVDNFFIHCCSHCHFFLLVSLLRYIARSFEWVFKYIYIYIYIIEDKTTSLWKTILFYIFKDKRPCHENCFFVFMFFQLGSDMN